MKYVESRFTLIANPIEGYGAPRNYHDSCFIIFYPSRSCSPEAPCSSVMVLPNCLERNLVIVPPIGTLVTVYQIQCKALPCHLDSKGIPESEFDKLSPDLKVRRWPSTVSTELYFKALWRGSISADAINLSTGHRRKTGSSVGSA